MGKKILFGADDRHSNLKGKSLRGGAVTLGAQAATFTINMASTMVLARLLTPEDFGVIAMVAAITGFAGIFSDLGLSMATIQKSDINERQVSALFWINFGLGAIISVVVVGLSPVVVWFYNAPELLWVTVVLSLSFIISGLAVQHRALLVRNMKFLHIATVEVLSVFLGLIVAIGMAMKGLGYWALVGNTLAMLFFKTIFYWLATGWKPCLYRRNSGVSSMLSFGADVAGFNVVNYFSRNLDNILLGRCYGSSVLGLYAKAYQLLMLPINNLRTPLEKVAMPALSRLQHEPERYRSYYSKFVGILAFVSMPLVVYMLVCSEQIIRVVLGPQWVEASVLFQILAVTALIQPVAGTRGIVLLSTGQSRKYLFWGAINAVVVMLAFVIGLMWGAKGVASAYAVANYLILVPSLIYVFKQSPVDVKDFFAAVYRPFLASVAAGAVCFLVQPFFSGGADIVFLVLSLGGYMGSYFLILGLFVGGLKDLREHIGYVRMAFAK